MSTSPRIRFASLAPPLSPNRFTKHENTIMQSIPKLENISELQSTQKSISQRKYLFPRPPSAGDTYKRVDNKIRPQTSPMGGRTEAEFAARMQSARSKLLGNANIAFRSALHFEKGNKRCYEAKELQGQREMEFVKEERNHNCRKEQGILSGINILKSINPSLEDVYLSENAASDANSEISQMRKRKEVFQQVKDNFERLNWKNSQEHDDSDAANFVSSLIILLNNELNEVSNALLFRKNANLISWPQTMEDFSNIFSAFVTLCQCFSAELASIANQSLYFFKLMIDKWIAEEQNTWGEKREEMEGTIESLNLALQRSQETSSSVAVKLIGERESIENAMNELSNENILLRNEVKSLKSKLKDAQRLIDQPHLYFSEQVAPSISELMKELENCLASLGDNAVANLDEWSAFNQMNRILNRAGLDQLSLVQKETQRLIDLKHNQIPCKDKECQTSLLSNEIAIWIDYARKSDTQLLATENGGAQSALRRISSTTGTKIGQTFASKPLKHREMHLHQKLADVDHGKYAPLSFYNSFTHWMNPVLISQLIARNKSADISGIAPSTPLAVYLDQTLIDYCDCVLNQTFARTITNASKSAANETNVKVTSQSTSTSSFEVSFLGAFQAQLQSKFGLEHAFEEEEILRLFYSLIEAIANDAPIAMRLQLRAFLAPEKTKNLYLSSAEENSLSSDLRGKIVSNRVSSLIIPTSAVVSRILSIALLVNLVPAFKIKSESIFFGAFICKYLRNEATRSSSFLYCAQTILGNYSPLTSWNEHQAVVTDVLGKHGKVEPVDSSFLEIHNFLVKSPLRMWKSGEPRFVYSHFLTEFDSALWCNALPALVALACLANGVLSTGANHYFGNCTPRVLPAISLKWEPAALSINDMHSLFLQNVLIDGLIWVCLPAYSSQLQDIRKSKTITSNQRLVEVMPLSDFCSFAFTFLFNCKAATKAIFVQSLSEAFSGKISLYVDLAAKMFRSDATAGNDIFSANNVYERIFGAVCKGQDYAPSISVDAWTHYIEEIDSFVISIDHLLLLSILSSREAAQASLN